jgi:peptide/nickel transport system substrate-binding protein
MGRIRRRRGLLYAGAAIVAAGSTLLGLAGAGATKPATKSHALSGTVTFANLPGSGPNYIFPFENLSFFSVPNQQYFQNLMYRPLYWFGTGAAPTLNLTYSVAKAPVYSNGNKTVTISMNGYKWSDGEAVTAQDVAFWLNMYRTNPGGYAGYVPGTIPDDISSIVVKSPSQLVLNLTSAVNSYWYTYNELSQIYPMPMAWDVTALGQKAGAEACATAPFTSITVTKATVKGSTTWTPVSAAAKSCEAVYNFLSEQSGYNPTSSAKSTSAFATYVSSPIWSVVDGPWKLQTFNATGDDTFVPNPSYTGPVKPTYAKFVLQYFTSDTAEVNSLFGHQTDIGYLNPQNITAPAKSETQAGPNNPRLSSSYNIALGPTWAIAYGLYNFTSTGDGGQAGKIIGQLYFRQAMQDLVDQTLYVKKLDKGYGSPTYGPVPVLPKSPFVTTFEQKNPYPYNAAKAKALLVSHGWSIVPGGTDVCQVASKCGVPKGTKLSLTMSYATGQQFFTDQVTAEDEAWSALGIHVALIPGSFTTVAGDAVPSNHSWDIANYGLWIFSPDYYPTGEELFQTGAGSNAGSYSDPTADKLIKATDFSTNNSYFAKYENYLAIQLPYLWQPNTIAANEVSKTVTGVTPFNSLDAILPETWHLKG